MDSDETQQWSVEGRHRHPDDTRARFGRESWIDLAVTIGVIVVAVAAVALVCAGLMVLGWTGR
jgi:hypothetical protein